MDINSSLITELSLKILILIKLEMDHVKLKLDLSKSLNSPMLDKEVLKPQPLLLLNNQYPLLLMLLTSNSILMVSFLIVRHLLITELLLLDIPQMLGLLKTPGLNLGEKKDISDQLEETLVGLLTLLLILPSDEYLINIYQ